MLRQEQFNDGNCHYNEAWRHCPITYIATTSHQCDGEFGKSDGEQKCDEVLSLQDRDNCLKEGKTAMPMSVVSMPPITRRCGLSAAANSIPRPSKKTPTE